ncbi:hypothetical protein ACPEEZ_03530 [Frigoribacterium sp. 2-23]|uniref:hypothetical protein n=1 Tax=Frigoribacterium sp. 2-23 TaxID=3415006 RepID=UPI003C6FC049
MSEQQKDPAQHDVDGRLDPEVVHGDGDETVEAHGTSAADDAALEGAVDELDDLQGGAGPLR